MIRELRRAVDIALRYVADYMVSYDIAAMPCRLITAALRYYADADYADGEIIR